MFGTIFLGAVILEPFVRGAITQATNHQKGNFPRGQFPGDIVRAQLSLGKFSGSNNLGAIIQGAIFLGANCPGSIILGGNYPGSNLRGTTFIGGNCPRTCSELTQPVNELWSVFIIFQKNKVYQKIIQKLRTENQFHTPFVFEKK